MTTDRSPSDSPAGQGVSGMFTGPAVAAATPQLALPFTRMVIGAMAGAGLAACAAVAILALLGKFSLPILLTVGGGALSGWLACALGFAALRPWNPRPHGQWPFVLLGAQAMSCFGVLAFASLIYFSTRPDTVALALASAAGFLGSWAGLVRVFSALLDARTRIALAKPNGNVDPNATDDSSGASG